MSDDEGFDDVDEQQQDQPQVENSQPQPEVMHASLMDTAIVR
jgi:hypothetical protein